MKIFVTSMLCVAVLGAGGSAFSAGPAGCAAHGVGGAPIAAYARGGYVVSGVRVTGLGPGCAGRTVAVTLTTAAGRIRLIRLAAVVPGHGGTLVLRARHHVAAAAVTGVSVALDG